MTIEYEDLLALVAFAAGDDIEIESVQNTEISGRIGARREGDGSWTSVEKWTERNCLYFPTSNGAYRSSCGRKPVKLDKTGVCVHCSKPYIQVVI